MCLLVRADDDSEHHCRRRRNEANEKSNRFSMHAVAAAIVHVFGSWLSRFLKALNLNYQLNI